jgi:hypothetical protein
LKSDEWKKEKVTVVKSKDEKEDLYSLPNAKKKKGPQQVI